MVSAQKAVAVIATGLGDLGGVRAARSCFYAQSACNSWQWAVHLLDVDYVWDTDALQSLASIT